MQTLYMIIEETKEKSLESTISVEGKGRHLLNGVKLVLDIYWGRLAHKYTIWK